MLDFGCFLPVRFLHHNSYFFLSLPAFHRKRLRPSNSSLLIINFYLRLCCEGPALSASGDQLCSCMLPRPCDHSARREVLTLCYPTSTSRRRHSLLEVLRSLLR